MSIYFLWGLGGVPPDDVIRLGHFLQGKQP
jgi:hypothetical protein